MAIYIRHRMVTVASGTSRDRVYSRGPDVILYLRSRLLAIVTIVAIPVVVVVSVAIDTAIRHTHIERTIQAEGHDRAPRNANGGPHCLPAANRAYYRAYQAVVA